MTASKKNLAKFLVTFAMTPFLTAAQSVLAYMPAGGLWVIDSENNGQSGRGFQIEVENEVLVFTYFGYRPDGSGTFYLAAGPVTNNTFSANLTEYQGGNALGAAYSPAHASGSPGTVTISFSSGKHGTMTLPGEAPQSISKFGFGYPNGPDGLLGSWIFSEILSAGPNSIVRNLSVKTGTSSGYGNGIVVTAAGDFACEFGTVGAVAGVVVCVDVPQTTYSDSYFFKFSGDRGVGVGYYITSSGTNSSNYELHALRMATKTGRETGLNDGTETSLQAMSRARTSSSSADIFLKQQDNDLQASSAVESVKAAGSVQPWATEIRAALMAQ